MVDAPMNTLVPKYSDGSFCTRPLVWAASFLTLPLAPMLTSAFHSRSPTQYEPHSTTAYRRPGNLSNFPDSSSCQRMRCVQNGTSSTNWAMFSLYESQSPSPEWVCTTSPASAQASQNGSYTAWP